MNNQTEQTDQVIKNEAKKRFPVNAIDGESEITLHTKIYRQFIREYFIEGAKFGYSLASQQSKDSGEGMRKALEKIIEMNRQQAEDQYGDREKAENWACVRIARQALAG